MRFRELTLSSWYTQPCMTTPFAPRLAQSCEIQLGQLNSAWKLTCLIKSHSMRFLTCCCTFSCSVQLLHDFRLADS